MYFIYAISVRVKYTEYVFKTLWQKKEDNSLKKTYFKHVY